MNIDNTCTLEIEFKGAISLNFVYHFYIKDSSQELGYRVFGSKAIVQELDIADLLKYPCDMEPEDLHLILEQLDQQDAWVVFKESAEITKITLVVLGMHT